MTKNCASDTKQEHSHDEQKVHGEKLEHGHTGEGAASAMAHMISQDQKHRRQNGEPEEPGAGSGHP